MIPLQAIKGSKGPFLNACNAMLLNDIIGFQEKYDRKYQDWAHLIAFGDNLVIYIWDTREVIDVISGIHAAAKGGPVTRTIVNPDTKETIIQTIGHRKFGWAKFIYDQMMQPWNHRHDNGLPLKTKNAEWLPVINQMNEIINKRYAFESVSLENKTEFSEDERAELAVAGFALPDGSFPIRNIEDLEDAIQSIGRAKDYEVARTFIIRRAKQLEATDKLPEAWQEFVEGVECGEYPIVATEANSDDKQKITARAKVLMPTILKHAEHRGHKHTIILSNIEAFLFEFMHDGGQLSKATAKSFFEWYES